jgi:hypothetical protein
MGPSTGGILTSPIGRARSMLMAGRRLNEKDLPAPRPAPGSRWGVPSSSRVCARAREGGGVRDGPHPLASASAAFRTRR